MGKGFTECCRTPSVKGMTWAERKVDVPLCVKAGLPEGTEAGMLIDHLRLQKNRRRGKLRC